MSSKSEENKEIFRIKIDNQSSRSSRSGDSHISSRRSGRHCGPESKDYLHSRRPDMCKYVPTPTGFTSLITPTSALTVVSTGVIGEVPFLMSKKTNQVILQWTAFSGQIASSGVAFLSVSQIISNLPAYVMRFPIRITYKGVAKMSFLEIDPSSSGSRIKFYLDISGSGDGVVATDSFIIDGSSVSWITV